MAAPYVLTTDAPFDDSGQMAYVDTVWTTSGTNSDTLMFGFVATSACVWTDAAETAQVQWIMLSATATLSPQTRGTTPPTASRAKARYGAKRFVSTLYTVPASTTYCTPFPVPVYRGVIIKGTGSAVTVNVSAVRAPRW